jgi:sulfur carrier protein ThiS
MSLKAVAVNGEPVPERTNHIAIDPGDEVTAELFISDWGDEIVTVRIFQARILGEVGSQSGESGTMLPRGWPMDPVQGLFQDQARPDWIFAGSKSWWKDFDVTLDVRFGSVIINGEGPMDDGMERYGGTMILVASDDACGTFTFDFDTAASFVGEDISELVYIAPEPLMIDVVRDPALIGACPDNCAIDARYPHDPANNAFSLLWDTVNVRLGWIDATTLDCSSFLTSFVGGPPVLLACFFVNPIGADTVEVGYSRAIPTARWTCLGLIGGRPGADQICLAALPGDVNADRVSDGGDVLSLVDSVYGGTALKPWQCDIDRDGACTHLDLLGLVDVLVGANEFIPWIGATILVPCPSASLNATCGDLPPVE